MASIPSQAIPELQRLGERLRHAREQQGISREELAERLHLGTEQLVALETADSARLHEPVFVIAQARRLAAALNLGIEPEISALRRCGMAGGAGRPGLAALAGRPGRRAAGRAGPADAEAPAIPSPGPGHQQQRAGANRARPGCLSGDPGCRGPIQPAGPAQPGDELGGGAGQLRPGFVPRQAGGGEELPTRSRPAGAGGAPGPGGRWTGRRTTATARQHRSGELAAHPAQCAGGATPGCAGGATAGCAGGATAGRGAYGSRTMS